MDPKTPWRAKHDLPDDQDELVPDPEVRREFDISPATEIRWDLDPRMIALGWPPIIRIGQKRYRSRRAIEAFKRGLIKRASAERGKLVAETA
jgi:hypothetical protein